VFRSPAAFKAKANTSTTLRVAQLSQGHAGPDPAVVVAVWGGAGVQPGKTLGACWA